MVSKAWDSRLKLPGLIVERRAVVDGVVEMSGRLAAVSAQRDAMRLGKGLHGHGANAAASFDAQEIGLCGPWR